MFWVMLPPETTAGGANSPSITDPVITSCGYSAASRRTRFSSSRTLPGQRCCFNRSSACGIELLGRQAVLLGQCEEMPDQVRQILDAFAQRRQPQRHDVEAEEQILAEQPLLDQDAQVLVGGGDDPHVGLDRGAAADRGVFALLQHAQQPGLRLHRHVADLVEEQRAALGLLEPAGGAGVGAGEGAALVAEQFGLRSGRAESPPC